MNKELTNTELNVEIAMQGVQLLNHHLATKAIDNDRYDIEMRKLFESVVSE